jgi:hypothetical protein
MVLTVALWVGQGLWANNVCWTNPRLPDPQHTIHFLSVGRHFSRWCYVSSATADMNEWMFIALGVSIAISVVIGCVMWRSSPSR